MFGRENVDVVLPCTFISPPMLLSLNWGAQFSAKLSHSG